MQAHIFAEGSKTTADDHKLPIKQYYEGLFRMVAGLHDELAAFADTDLHVLSEEYGLVDSHERPSEIRDNREMPTEPDVMIAMAREKLLRASSDADVMVILLSTDIFWATVVHIWNEVVAAAKSDSIWCFGAARSALAELDFEPLEAKGCSVLTYQRVGVARIGTDTREELLETVKQNATQ
jgi:hypothetical protein